MTVKARYVHEGIEVEVIDHPDFFGWRATGQTFAEALEHLAAAVRVEGYRGPIHVWRRVP